MLERRDPLEGGALRRHRGSGAGRFPHRRLHDGRSWLMSNSAPGLSPWMIGSVAFRRDLISASGFYRPDRGEQYQGESVFCTFGQGRCDKAICH